MCFARDNVIVDPVTQIRLNKVTWYGYTLNPTINRNGVNTNGDFVNFVPNNNAWRLVVPSDGILGFSGSTFTYSQLYIEFYLPSPIATNVFDVSFLPWYNGSTNLSWQDIQIGIIETAGQSFSSMKKMSAGSSDLSNSHDTIGNYHYIATSDMNIVGYCVYLLNGSGIPLINFSTNYAFRSATPSEVVAQLRLSQDSYMTDLLSDSFGDNGIIDPSQLPDFSPLGTEAFGYINLVNKVNDIYDVLLVGNIGWYFSFVIAGIVLVMVIKKVAK